MTNAELEAKAHADDKAKAEAEAKAKAEADDKAKAEAKAHADDKAKAEAEAKERVKGIIGHAEAEGRQGLANHLAFETGMSVEEAGKLLATSPKEIKGGKLGPAMVSNRPGISSQEDQPAGKAAINPQAIYVKRAEQAAAFRGGK